MCVGAFEPQRFGANFNVMADTKDGTASALFMASHALFYVFKGPPHLVDLIRGFIINLDISRSSILSAHCNALL